MYIELDRKFLRERYNGNAKKCIAANEYSVWTADRIKKCFNFGNGTLKHLKEYMQNNKKYCIFLQV